MGIPEYVWRLRQKVGHEPLLLPSVTVYAFDERDRMLLVRDRQLDVWVAPGGCLEPGERPEDAAVREAREETGVEIEVLGLQGVQAGPECRTVYNNGDVVDYVMAGYFARITGGNLRPCQDEVTEARFVEERELAGLQLAQWTRVNLPRVFAQWRERKRDHRG